MINTVTMTTTVDDKVSLRGGQETFFISVLNSWRKVFTFSGKLAEEATDLLSSEVVLVPGNRSINLSLNVFAISGKLLSYPKRMAGQEGFEPPSRGFGVRCSAVRATGLCRSLTDLLGFLVRSVFAARRAEFLQLKFIGRRLFVFRRCIVSVLAISASQNDDVAHFVPFPFPFALPLLYDFRHDARANGAAAFADRETKLFLHGYRSDQLN